MPVRKMAGSHRRVMGELVVRGKKDQCLSWEDAYREMAREREYWSDLEAVVGDGLDPREAWRARTR